jgi:cysteine desulfurase
MRQVYLDHAASTPLLPEAFEAMKPFLSEFYGSPSSFHQQGLRARDALATARERVAAMIHAASPEEIVFTSSGTESANLAIKGVAYANQRLGKHIVASAIEHPSVLNSIEFLEKQGFSCTRVAVDAQGRIDPEAVRAALTDQTVLIAVHLANHDIGTIQPVKRLSDIALDRGIPFFVDASHAAGWIPIDVHETGIALLSLAPHRFYGPKGVGVLYQNRRARLAPLIHGGVQEGGRRAGSENVPAIVGAGVAAEVAARELPQRVEHVARMQQKLLRELRSAITCMQLNGPEPGPDRICTNLNISVEFVEGEGLMLLADTRGIAFASGTACVSKSIKASAVLAAMGVDHSLALGAIILSLGKDNTPEDIDYVVETLPKLVDRLRGMSPVWDDFKRGVIKSRILFPPG